MSSAVAAGLIFNTSYKFFDFMRPGPEMAGSAATEACIALTLKHRRNLTFLSRVIGPSVGLGKTIGSAAGHFLDEKTLEENVIEEAITDV